MAATIQTTNGVLATGVHHDNPGSTITESAGTWTVSHASKLTVLAAVGHRAGYSLSYSANVPLAWATDIRSIVSEGRIAKHDLNCLIVEDGTGDDADFVSSYQPARGATSHIRASQSDALLGTIRHLL